MGFLNKLFGKKENIITEDVVEEKQTMSTPPVSPPPEPEPLQINEVTPDELKARIDNGDDIVVVDMRQAWEYTSGHIPGATHIFIQEIPQHLAELPKDKDIIFQCWSGNTSLQASGFLIENGWDADKVFSLIGGIGGWSTTFGPEGLVKD